MKGKANRPETERVATPGAPPKSPALVRFDPGPRGSRTLLPNDHVKALVELLRGQTPDLARRWLSALLIVPERERESVVSAVERGIVAEYPQTVESNERITRAGARELRGDGASAGESTTASPTAQHGTTNAGEPENAQFRVVYPPVQKQGYVESVEKSFEVVGDAQTSAESGNQQKGKGARGVKGAGRRGGASRA